MKKKTCFVCFSLSENKAFRATGFFVKLPICSEYGMCFYSSIVSICVCVCVHNVPQLARSPSEIHSLSGHSFFPGFHPIVFEEMGLVAHLQSAGWLHSVLIAWEQQEEGVREGGGGLVTVYYSLVE